MAGHDDLGQRAPRHGPPGAGDLAVDDLGGGRQVEQVGERPRVAADDDLARREDGDELRGVEDHGVGDVGDGPVQRADPVRRVEIRGVDPALDDGGGERGVGVGDQGGVRAPVGVGEAGEQVRGVATSATASAARTPAAASTASSAPAPGSGS